MFTPLLNKIKKLFDYQLNHQLAKMLLLVHISQWPVKRGFTFGINLVTGGTLISSVLTVILCIATKLTYGSDQ